MAKTTKTECERGWQWSRPEHRFEEPIKAAPNFSAGLKKALNQIQEFTEHKISENNRGVSGLSPEESGRP